MAIIIATMSPIASLAHADSDAKPEVSAASAVPAANRYIIGARKGNEMPDKAIPISASDGHPLRPASFSVPTTKILAIGHWTAKGTPDARAPILTTEMRETARLYLAGKVDQWYFKTDESGVVLVMNLIAPEEAHALLKQLPLGQAGMMEFQFVPLGPIKPLALLLNEKG
ncbi:hypothetical protein JUN65_00280 [Gluconacetobacter azotocaptans]|uniref:hypothetical protein n=1 Tax=Gluconacetobacter azotocaptans TaxID=142834 RepID=UPI00195B393F|nr:hypothetical protein [Gluconacetobacter azotocaptans]MBM9400035.1 hypothetical protein [Gluconacetobacter azotocaptans]